jgi:hypothetical protein
MFIETPGEELLNSGFRGGAGGSPDFLSVPLARAGPMRALYSTTLGFVIKMSWDESTAFHTNLIAIMLAPALFLSRVIHRQKEEHYAGRLEPAHHMDCRARQ